MTVTDSYDEMWEHLREAKERFAADRRDATMTVLKDDGVYRHLAFSFPKATWSRCEVVTWPEMLVLRGNLGCWSFSRVEDMFDFFREPAEEIVRINPQHTAEKLVPGGSNSAMAYDSGRAAAYIRQTVAENADDHAGLAADVDNLLFSDYKGTDLTTEQGLREALARFEGCTEGDYEGFRFPVEEWDLNRYSPWFLLACVLLPWAIEQYDAQLAPVG